MRTCIPSVCRTSAARLRPGLTIIEMIVSLACIVMLMLAYTQLFSDVGNRIGDARSMIELTKRMTAAQQRLRADLAGLTCTTIPPRDPKNGEGYLEIIEGPLHDVPNTFPASDGTSSLWDYNLPVLGDTDDVLLLTTNGRGTPFTGRIAGTAAQSQDAEVIWFLRPTLKDDPTKTQNPVNPLTYTLYRHVHLISPVINGTPVTVTAANFKANDTTDPNSRDYDLSVHPETDASGNITTYRANTLGDLTKREWRTAHDFPPDNYPHRLMPDLLMPFGAKFDSAAPRGFSFNTGSTVPSYSRYGEDVVLTNVLSFDIKVWDPTAPVRTNSGVAVVPGEPGFQSGTTVNGAAGAFVDLNYGSAFGGQRLSTFSGAGSSSTKISKSGKYLDAIGVANPTYDKSWLQYQLSDTTNYKQPATWDSFSIHYEHDGVQQLAGPATVTDQGTNGFDDAVNGVSNGIVDDIDERETIAPYPVPLRGIQITIRCYEPDSRQVHEVRVVESFVPE